MTPDLGASDMLDRLCMLTVVLILHYLSGRLVGTVGTSAHAAPLAANTANLTSRGRASSVVTLSTTSV